MWFLAACLDEKRTSHLVDEADVDTDTDSDADSDSDSDSDSDTDTDTDTDTGTDPIPPVPGILPDPTGTLVSSERWYGLELSVLGDTDGDGLDEIAIGAEDTLLVESGAVLGRVDVAPFVHGRFLGGGDTEVQPAGDTDGDGFGDVWRYWTLYRGPVVGDLTDADAHAFVDTPYLPCCRPVAGAFDADGDGLSDALVADYGYPQAFSVLYGPFAGAVPGPNHPDLAADALRITFPDSGWEFEYSGGVYAAGGWNDPDEVVALIVNCDDYTFCHGWGFDVAGRRGRELTETDAVAKLEHCCTTTNDSPIAAGDLDGDGLDDLYYAESLVTAPILGDLRGPPRLFDSGLDGTSLRADVTGDGRADLVVDEYDQRFWLLPSTVLDAGVPLDRALVEREGVELVPTVPNPRGWRTADLDGDGHDELLTWQAANSDGFAGAVDVWSGAALVAAVAGP